MEGNIFKPEITKEKMKRKLEVLMERLENTKEDEISRINDDIVEIGMMNRPDLEELVKRELLELIPTQIENEFSMIHQCLISEDDTAPWYDIADSIYEQHLSDNSLAYGYFTWNANNEKALMSIRCHKCEYWNAVYDEVLDDAKYNADNWDESFEFGAWMRRGFAKFFEDYASNFQCDLDELKEGYEIDVEALSLGDIMFIHNKLSEELKSEKKYSDEEILENLKEYEEL
jgi:hypothetical protein